MTIQPVSTEGLKGKSNEDILNDYLHHIEHVQMMRPQSLRTYRTTLRHWIEHVGDAPLSIVHPSHVEEFGQRMRRGGKPPSAHTRRREITIVRAFHLWANEHGYDVPTVSTAATPKLPEAAPKPIPDDLWLQVWRGDLPDDARLLMGLGYFCGLRRIELVTISPTAVDVDTGTIRFERKGGKTVPIEYVEMVRWAEKVETPVAEGAWYWIDLLERTAERRRELGANQLWWESIDHPEADVTRLAKRLRVWLHGVGADRGAFTPHQLRHSCATNLLRAGLDLLGVAEQLSHSDTKVTRRYLQTSGHLRRQYEQRYGKADFNELSGLEPNPSTRIQTSE